jgi:hypothetical protein
VQVGALSQSPPDVLQPFWDESHGLQDDVDLHPLESHVVRHGPHESLLPHDSDLSPHGSHLLAQELHRLSHLSVQGSHLQKFEKHAAMACQLHSVLWPSQGLHLVEHVGWLQGRQSLPPHVLQLLGAQLLDLLTIPAQGTTQLAERSNRSSNDSTADTGLHDQRDC